MARGYPELEAIAPGSAVVVACRFPAWADSGSMAPPFQQAPDERRRAPRRRALLTAIVVNNAFDGIFRCQIRDVSETGARLVIPASFLVPAGFWLIAVSSGLAYPAKLVWRKYPDAGVVLGEPIELDEATTRVARRLRAVWVTATT